MAYHPKVSIVIPAYNAANYLAEAIESALNQTYSNIEVIVVNDGSKDDGATASVAQRYKDRIRYFEKENGGSSSALNYGIKSMTGEWFSWLSHDDLYCPEKVQWEIDYLNALPLNFDEEDNVQKHILFAAADLIDANGAIVQKMSSKRLCETDAKINHVEGALRLIAEPVQSGFHGCSCLIHRKAFEKCGMFDENLRLLNDMDMWFRFYSNGYKIHFVPKVLVKGRVHAKQVSRSIGFSYHNSEQDMFWNRSLAWLTENYPERFDLFYSFGKTAFLKTRYAEGERAFATAGAISKKKRTMLAVKKYVFMIRAGLRAFAKEVYMRIKA